MAVRLAMVVIPCLALTLVVASASAQAPAPVHHVKGVVPPAVSKFKHHKKLRAVYDSLADSTRLSVMTHRGQYFLTVKRPRLTWSVVYGGQKPGAEPPAEIWLEFRTQSPQVALDSRLDVLYGSGQRLEVPSAGAHSDPGILTWNYFMRFAIPMGSFAEVLRTQKVLITVGGVSEYLEPEQLEALRDLVSRVGEGAPAAAASGYAAFTPAPPGTDVLAVEFKINSWRRRGRRRSSRAGASGASGAPGGRSRSARPRCSRQAPTSRR